MVPLVPSSGSGSLMFWDYNDPGGQAETLIGKKKKVRLLIIKWLLYIFYKHTHTIPLNNTHLKRQQQC